MCELPLARRVGRRRVGEIRIPVGEFLSSSAVCVRGQWHALDALATGVRQSRGVSLNLNPDFCTVLTVLRELRLATRPSRHHQESRSSPSRRGRRSRTSS